MKIIIIHYIIIIKTDYMSTIQSNNHVINALNLSKISLSPFDDNRYYIDNIRNLVIMI